MNERNVWEMWGFISYNKSPDYKATINVVDENYTTMVLKNFDETIKVTFDYFKTHLGLTISTPHIQLNSTDTNNSEAISLLNKFVPDWYCIEVKPMNKQQNTYEKIDDDDFSIGLTD